MIAALLIAVCVLLTAYGQLVNRWQLREATPMTLPRLAWLSSAMGSLIIRAVLWMALLSRFEVSSLYPLMSLSFVLVPLLGVWLLDEQVTREKVLGGGLITAGVIMIGVDLWVP